MIFQNDLIEKILDNIEDYESKLLAWGIVDVFQSKDEIYEMNDKAPSEREDYSGIEDLFI